MVNSQNASRAPPEPITSLQQITVTAAAAKGGSNNSISVSTNGTINFASGDNYFPDLGTHWQVAEFNVFGDGNNDQAVFNTGSTVVVRTSVASGTSSGPSCDAQSFTGESNNLTLTRTTQVPSITALPSLVFTESNAPGSVQADCSGAVSVSNGPPIVVSVSPTEGQCGTATAITIRGSNFTRVTSIVADSHSNLSPVPLQDVSVSPDHINATVPTYLPGGVYEIVVTTALGGSTRGFEFGADRRLLRNSHGDRG